MGKFIDLTGRKFKQLTVIRQLPDHYTSGGNKVHKWLCECECGRDDNVVCSTGDLTSGRRWRCTYCVRDDAANRMKERNKKYNPVDLYSRDYGVGWTLNTNEEFWFDKEDYDKIKDFCIYKHHDYFMAKINNEDGKKKAVGLHKLIMDDIENEYDIDHIKTEYKHDNRKLNLRRTTRQQNNSNSKLKSNNTSGVAGVHWHSRDKVWEAWIRFNYKNIYLGRYLKFDDAVKARKAAEEEYFGEFSYDNSQKLYEELTNGGL